jgi:hypothetical protein
MGPVAPAPAGPQRWPLVLLGVAVLVGGVSLALRRPPAAVRPAPSPPAAPPPSAPAPPATAGVPGPVAPPTNVAAPPAVPAHKVRLRAERHPARPSVTAPANAETSDAVKRGVLPPASREGYPEK